MGATSKTCSVLLRVGEFVSAVIVVAIVGRWLHFVSSAHAHAGSRIIYAEVIAGISILASIVLAPPFKYSFYCFPLDFVLFILWMVAFGLLCNLTVHGGCHSTWYWNSWGYYWGSYWRTVPRGALTPAIVGTSGCSSWRAVLSFAFIGGFCWLLSGFLGIYVCTKSPEDQVSRDGMEHVPGEPDHVTNPSGTSRWRRKSHQEPVPTKVSTEGTTDTIGNQA